MNKSYVKPLVLITALLAIAVLTLIFLSIPHATLPPAVTIDTTGQPTLGVSTARVHFVAFEDLKCGNCQRYSTTLFPEIKKEYINTGIAQYTIIVLAFVPGSIPAGNAALCLYQQNPAYFFPFIEYLYQHQLPEETDWATIATLLQFAQASVPNADQNTLSNCIFTNQNTARLNSNMQLAGKIMNPVATPTIYINGRLVQPLTMERIHDLVSAVQRTAD